MGNFIKLHSGGTYDYTCPDPDSIRIEDIAHALSNMCRYAGHVPKFYSVAEHCVKVSSWLKTLGKSVELQLKGLLHDASEAYCVDIPSPLKHQPEIEAGYKFHELRAQAAIASHFRLWMPIEDPEVMEIDKAILQPEQEWRAGDVGKSFGWPPAVAEAAYLEKFKELWSQYENSLTVYPGH